MLAAIKYGIANLTRFKGRDGRQTFFYWLLFVVLLHIIVAFAISIPMTVRAMGVGVSAAQQGADPALMQGQIIQSITATMPIIAWASVAVGLVTMALLAASLVRRLHDWDMTGWLVLVPGVFYAVALARMPGEAAHAIAAMAQAGTAVAGDATMMRSQGLQTLLSWVPVLLVVLIGLRKSTPGRNRYGSAPVSF